MMLKIRDAQISIFATASAARFQRAAMEHLKKSFPAHTRVLGDPALEKVVQYGIDRALGHGITGANLLRLYLGLMFTLGSDFDRDPQLPWASAILSDEVIPSAGAKMEMISSRALSFVERVAGVRGEHLVAALHRLRAHPWLERAPEPHRPSPDEVSALLARLYPEKHRALEEQGTLDTVFVGGSAAALGHGVTDPWGVHIFTLLVFMLGSSFDSDLQHPWVAVALTDSAAPAAARAELLCRASLAYVDRLTEEIAREQG